MCYRDCARDWLAGSHERIKANVVLMAHVAKTLPSRSAAMGDSNFEYGRLLTGLTRGS